jgi:hypothetical protein
LKRGIGIIPRMTSSLHISRRQWAISNKIIIPLGVEEVHLTKIRRVSSSDIRLIPSLCYNNCYVIQWQLRIANAV